MKREMICICCPIGCRLTVKPDGKGTLSVTGNSCPRGEIYGREEITNPTRVLTTTVRLQNSGEMISVKSSAPLPKGKLLDTMKLINAAVCQAPVAIGDILIENIGNTGIHIIATKNSKEV